MADALALRLKELIKHSKEFDFSHGRTDQHFMRMMAESCNGLMNHLREMMAGYENQQVIALLKNMEGLINHRTNMMAGYDVNEMQVKPKELEDLFAMTSWDLEKAPLQFGVDKDLKRRLDKMVVICEELCNIRYKSYVEEEDVVGFDDEIEPLLDQLTGTSSTNHFQIISITGMAGLGKTTLATTLYNHELVKYMFDIRAWTCVSQTYIEKDLLLNILSFFMGDLTDEFSEMSEQQLGEKLYRSLKGRKYLVAFDDIWDCRVWNNLKMYFPDDKTGSRVLFTSRDIIVSLHVNSARPAHVLRLRTEDESWSIFQKKVFRMGICPHGLEKSGRVINRKCEGLPLAIVIAAGLLKNVPSVTWWEQIAESLRSFLVSDPRQYTDSLALSYNHMPLHLRQCFLFFGAFPEDYEVPVTNLIWLWIAQGFIHETGNKMLEDVAEDFLMDLIKRSMLMTSRIKANGHVKKCRIHDLLRDFCLRKVKEESFMYNSFSMLSSMLCFPLELGNLLQEGGSLHMDTYNSLKILDLESILISVFPLDVVQMVNLRYLAIQARDGSPHASISKLVSLQMLIISIAH